MGKKKVSRITEEMLLEAILDSRGFVSDIAARLGLSRKHIYDLMEKYPSAKVAREDERENTKDWVEQKLLSRMEKNDTTAMIFYAKTQMKDRGYIERQEITGGGGAALFPTVYLPEVVDAGDGTDG